jgi:hypothetical protein
MFPENSRHNLYHIHDYELKRYESAIIDGPRTFMVLDIQSRQVVEPTRVRWSALVLTANCDIGWIPIGDIEYNGWRYRRL